MSTAYANMKQTLPTQESLNEMLENLLAIFEVDSILKSRALPMHPVQREYKGSPDNRHIFRPMLGNDFHIHASFTVSPPSWEAILQLEQAGGSKVYVPLCHIEQHSQLDGHMIKVRNAEEAATLLRAAWPDASIGPSRRRQLGPDFHDSESSSYQIFRWLASKQLNPVSEGVFLHDFLVSGGRRFEPLRQGKRGLVVRPSAEADWKHISVASQPTELDRRYQHDPDTQFWSFTGPERWVISLPVISTILLLMTNPTKKVDANSNCPDRELSWCLDSLHGFCRRKGPEEDGRNLSWSQGTFPDCWMYLHFIFYHFSPYDDQTDVSEWWKGTGILCERRKLELPIGWDGSIKSFQEERFWFGMRTSTTYRTAETDEKEHQATVAFVAGDTYHIPVDVKHKAWLKRGLESPKGASGVALFHMLIWSGIDEWNRGWSSCLDYIDGLHELKVKHVADEVTIDMQSDVQMLILGKIEDLGAPNPKLSTFLSDDKLANTYFVTMQLLKVFRKHIDVLPQKLHDMRRGWERTYPGLDADLLARFNEETQEILLKNWDKLLEHVKELHSNLVKRIEEKIKELASRRDSIFLARRAIQA